MTDTPEIPYPLPHQCCDPRCCATPNHESSSATCEVMLPCTLCMYDNDDPIKHPCGRKLGPNGCPEHGLQRDDVALIAELHSRVKFEHDHHMRLGEQYERQRSELTAVTGGRDELREQLADAGNNVERLREERLHLRAEDRQLREQLAAKERECATWKQHAETEARQRNALSASVDFLRAATHGHCERHMKTWRDLSNLAQEINLDEDPCVGCEFVDSVKRYEAERQRADAAESNRRALAKLANRLETECDQNAKLFHAAEWRIAEAVKYILGILASNRDGGLVTSWFARKEDLLRILTARAPAAMEPSALGVALEVAEYGWSVIANAGQGDWKTMAADWEEGATKYREMYHRLLDLIGGHAKSRELQGEPIKVATEREGAQCNYRYPSGRFCRQPLADHHMAEPIGHEFCAEPPPQPAAPQDGRTYGWWCRGREHARFVTYEAALLDHGNQTGHEDCKPTITETVSEPQRGRWKWACCGLSLSGYDSYEEARVAHDHSSHAKAGQCRPAITATVKEPK